MKKINIIITRATPKISGAEIYTVNLLKELLKFKNITTMTLTNNKNFCELLKKEKISSDYVPTLYGEIGTKKELLKACIYLPGYIMVSLIRIEKYHAHSYINIVLMQSMTEKLFLTPFLLLMHYRVVWLEHGPIFQTSRAYLIKKLYLLMSRFPHTIIAVSYDTKNDLVQNKVESKKIDVLYIGIDTKKFFYDDLQMKKSRNVVDKAMVIGFMGTIGEEKGIMRFIQVAEYLLSQEKDMRFVVLGDGPLLDPAKQTVQKLKINSYFKFIGYTDNVAFYLKSMDILFLPTNHTEGLSLALLEAMAMRTLVYTHDMGGSHEFVRNGKTGYLYNSFNIKQIGDKILALKKNKTLRLKIQKSGAQYVQKNFNIAKNIRSFYDLFEKL